MKATHSSYNVKDSVKRITSILDSSGNEYREHKGIPSENTLTFQNGFYVDVTVLFVDIRGSKKLAESHTKPVLAKIYRAYISEVIAILKNNININDIYIEGDGIWAVFNTITNNDVDSVFVTAAQISSLINILNIQLQKKKYSELQIGIGIEDGETLYLKAGYSGHVINEIVWIGKVVGEAAKLCNFGNKEYTDKALMVSERVYAMLTENHKKLLSWNKNRNCYHGNIIDSEMDKLS